MQQQAQQQALLQQQLLRQQQQLMAIQQQPHLSELEKAQLINKIMQVIVNENPYSFVFLLLFFLSVQTRFDDYLFILL